jgi:hypothetical protein
MLHPTAPRECQNGPKEALAKIDRALRQAKSADKNRGSPASHNKRPRPAARKSKKSDNPQKDNQNMAVITTRRIS